MTVLLFKFTKNSILQFYLKENPKELGLIKKYYYLFCVHNANILFSSKIKIDAHWLIVQIVVKKLPNPQRH